MALIFQITAPIVSPRLSTGNTEPTYSPHIDMSLINDPANPNVLNATNDQGQMLITAICRNCTSWSNPPLDLTSTAAPFMFAFGPINDMSTAGWFGSSGSARWSNSLTNPLRSHSIYGQFTMNMQQATVATNPNSELPVLGTANNGASLVGNVKIESFDYLSGGHAATMCVVFALIMPLEFILRMWIKWIGVRIFMTTVSVILFIAGLALGFLVSPQFIRVCFVPFQPNADQGRKLTSLILRANITTAATKSSASSSSYSSSSTSPSRLSQTAEPRKRKSSNKNKTHLLLLLQLQNPRWPAVFLPAL